MVDLKCKGLNTDFQGHDLVYSIEVGCLYNVLNLLSIYLSDRNLSVNTYTSIVIQLTVSIHVCLLEEHHNNGNVFPIPHKL